MGIEPRVLFERALPQRPRLSLILLDWNVRESVHIIDYLQRQDVPRDWFEVLWIEYYDRVLPDIARRIEEARDRGATPPIDRWIVMQMPRAASYHKHLMYNVGVLASRGDLVMIGDSDAMVRPSFVRSLIDAFDAQPQLVLHLDEVRSHSRRFYPFNYPSFEEVLADGCINWRDGATTGLRDTLDPLHTRNYGACFCARRADVLAIGGADEHIDYLGHVCGPYDLTWRLANAGKCERWHDAEFLYHTWHPGSDGDENYLGPHDGRNLSTLALETRRTRRVLPLVENPVIRAHREGRAQDLPLQDLVSATIGGDRALTDWVIDDTKRAMAGGRTAWSQRRFADALAIWEPLLPKIDADARFLSDLGWSYQMVGRYAEAGLTFQRALALDPGNPSSRRGLAWNRSADGRHADAVSEFSAALEATDPLDFASRQEALRGRGWSRLHLGECKAAAEDFTAARAMLVEGDRAGLQDIHRGLGWISLRVRAYAEAAQHFERALAVLGDTRDGNYEDARRGRNEALAPGRQKASTAADIRCSLGEAYAVAGDHERARQAFAEALRLDRNHPRALCGLGWAALRLGRRTQAAEAFDRLQALRGVPDDIVIKAAHARGQVAYERGQFAHAVTELRRVLKLAKLGPDSATGRAIHQQIRRARYLVGNGELTLANLAHRERRNRIDMAVRLYVSVFRTRLAALLAREPRGKRR